MSWRTLAMSLILVGMPSVAVAHIQLDEPMARYTDQKKGPCGRADDPGRSDRVTVYEPGQKIVLKWRETVNHPGHYRISFDEDGQDDFKDPSDFMDYYSNPAVIMDEIADKRGGEYQVELQLPDVTCERCTLQVVQVMYDKPPYTVGGNDLYYQCADIALRRAATPDMGPGADMGTDMAPGMDMASPQDMGTTPTDMSKGVDMPAAVDMATTPQQDMKQPTFPTPDLQDDGCASAGLTRPSAGLGWALLPLLGVLTRRLRRQRRRA